MTAAYRGTLAPATDDNFDEAGYLAVNPDVAQAVRSGFYPTGRRHFELHGRSESRMMMLGARLGPGTLRSRLGRRVRQRLGIDVDGAGGMLRLEERIYDLEVAVAQLGDMLTLGEGAPPPPPKHLQERVVGSYNGSFIRSGFTSVVPQLQRVLATVDRQLDQFPRILDFGCGSGRAIYALSTLYPDARLDGTDIDPEAIGWLEQHWNRMADYTVCPLDPPMAFDDNTFDLAFGISVFTHLPEDLQHAWLADLRRVTKADGYVILTTHGEHAAHGELSDAQTQVLRNHGFLYTTSGYGDEIGLPAFYETAFHTHDYVRRVWSEYFEVAAIVEPGPGEHQDSVLLRKRR